MFTPQLSFKFGDFARREANCRLEIEVAFTSLARLQMKLHVTVKAALSFFRTSNWKKKIKSCCRVSL